MHLVENYLEVSMAVVNESVWTDEQLTMTLSSFHLEWNSCYVHISLKQSCQVSLDFY